MYILHILDYVFCISCGYMYYVLCFFFVFLCSHCAFSTTSYYWVWVFGDHLHDLFTVASHKESV